MPGSARGREGNSMSKGEEEGGKKCKEKRSLGGFRPKVHATWKKKEFLRTSTSSKGPRRNGRAGKGWRFGPAERATWSGGLNPGGIRKNCRGRDSTEKERNA